MIEFSYCGLSIRRQCKLLSINRSTLYYKPIERESENSKLKRIIDEEYTMHPSLGYRKLKVFLGNQGYVVNDKRVRRLMKEMGIQAIYPKPRTSIANKQHKKYPYLLKGKVINQVNQVWSTDITYIKLEKGFIYLTAVIDWYSRYVLSWRLSNTLDSNFCIEALNEALEYGKPEIFNTDQGVQYTSTEFTGILESAGIQISMDGKGRALDNIFVERLWRSVKYEEVYLKSYDGPRDAFDSLREYFKYYNNRRPHQSLGYKTPELVYNENIDRSGKVA
jgi:putative transposase